MSAGTSVKRHYKKHMHRMCASHAGSSVSGLKHAWIALKISQIRHLIHSFLLVREQSVLERGSSQCNPLGFKIGLELMVRMLTQVKTQKK
jgi:hypothetical protein